MTWEEGLVFLVANWSYESLHHSLRGQFKHNRLLHHDIALAQPGWDVHHEFISIQQFLLIYYLESSKALRELLSNLMHSSFTS